MPRISDNRVVNYTAYLIAASLSIIVFAQAWDSLRAFFFALLGVYPSPGSGSTAFDLNAAALMLLYYVPALIFGVLILAAFVAVVVLLALIVIEALKAAAGEGQNKTGP